LPAIPAFDVGSLGLVTVAPVFLVVAVADQRHSLDLDAAAQGQGRCLDRRAGRRLFTQELGVYAVHEAKLAHVGQEHCRFDHVLQAGATCF